ncbi:hypothetical protein ACTJJ0_03510 [Chitinophaga sp. 22321]|uniref:Uncharacterized protein n=1 Tax=Chitinophaga hostae TaxID=2831022 RepID=A0ABS5IXM5_9BACT|nr:hypothetical protein [Chitinophaga hostae]MBS0027710.1 hypothetical protein [Chitinophaga hostae]
MKNSNPPIDLSDIKDDYSQRPFRLSQHEIDNPQLVIADFWGRYSLSNFRKLLWNGFIKNLIMGQIDPLETTELYIDIERMIEVTFLLRSQTPDHPQEDI